MLLVVRETVLQDGLVPAPTSRPCGAGSTALAVDAQARADLIRRTLTGALRASPAARAPWSGPPRSSSRRPASSAARSDVAYASALQEVEDALRSGSLLRGEVVARWHEVVGTGDFMRASCSRASAVVRDRLAEPASPARRSRATAPRGGRAPARGGGPRGSRARRRAGGARLARARARRQGARRRDTGPRPCLRRAPRSDRRRRCAAWQGYVIELVRKEGAAKRTTARLASLGVNGAGLTVMLAVFASTGGLTGLEAVVAGGTSAVGHKLLEALLGDQAVRTLAARARDDLMERVDDSSGTRRERFAARPRGQDARRRRTSPGCTRPIDAIRRAS